MKQAELTSEQKEKERKLDNLIKIARFKMNEETPFFGILSGELIIRPAPLHLRGKIRTAAVTPTGICMYNPEFMSGLSFQEICGVLAHEALHPGLDFFGRFAKKDLSRANRAHDYAINLVITDNKSSGLALPGDCLLDEKYRDMSAEAIYLQLEDEVKQKQKQKGKGEQSQDQSGDQGSQSQSSEGQGEGQQSQSQSGGQGEGQQSQSQSGGQGESQQSQSQSGGQGEGQQSQSQSGDQDSQDQGNGSGNGEKDVQQGNDYTLEDDINQDIIDEIEREYYGSDGNKPSQEELKDRREQAKQRWRDALEQAAIADQADGKGVMPAWMKADVEGILFPKLDIGKILRRYFGRFGRKTQATFRKRNRRNLFDGNTFPMPGLTSNKPSLYVLIDTSGSMWDEEGFSMVKGTLGIIKNLANNGGYGIRIIMCDTEVKEDLDFEAVMKAVNQKKLAALGGGGSNFIPAFNYIWKDAIQDNNSQAPILCITDGYIDVPDKQPKIRTETMWVTPEGIKPPTKSWGTHAEMIF